ncbi:MAG: hypothetical protein CME62_13800 [Halobacteriovoraceae bacterium]|nr:hypothetical protein [Halobacteriovoraceae bacterium]|tara:strand:+ start:825 stop:1685 length:861 start_codon:yes stop_codon:yes gene_type:complete
MKKFVAFYFILIQVAMAGEVRIRREASNFEDQIKQVIRFLGQDNHNLTGIHRNITCNEDFNQIKIKNCGDNYLEVFENYTLAREYLFKLMNEVENYPVRDNYERIFTRQVLDKLYCMENKLNDVKYDCSHSSTCFEGANRMAHANIPIGLNFWTDDKINICPRYFNGEGINDINRAATLVHEASHYCGTDDLYGMGHAGMTEAGYAALDIPAQANGVDTRINNADNYEVWAVGGFCIPGRNCDQPRNRNNSTAGGSPQLAPESLLPSAYQQPQSNQQNFEDAFSDF